MEMRAIARRRMVLVADDDAEMRALIAATLRRSGIDVIEVADGSALLQALSGPHDVLPDLVITDVNMPGITGLDALATANAQIPGEVPFIVITAFGDERCRERAEALGAEALFAKPFSLVELHDFVIEVLGF